MAAQRYVPGRTPAGPGLFWRFARPTRALDAALATLQDEGDAYERRRRRVLLLVPALVVLALVGPLVDLELDFGARTLTRFTPVALGAATLVAWAAALRPPRRSPLLDAARREYAKAAVAVVLLAGFGLFGVLFLGAGWMTLVPFGALLALPLVALLAAPTRRLLPLLVARLTLAVRGEPGWRAPLRDLRALVGALEPLLAPGRPVAGFVDLTGPEREWKELRLPPRPDLGPHRVFRDEWAQLEFELRAGGRLRLRLVEQLDRRDAGTTLALHAHGTQPLPRDPTFSRHHLVVCLWPEPGAAAPRAVTTRPLSVTRLALGARRRLVELHLADGRIDLDAVSAALRLLDPELRLARSWGRA